MQVVLLELLSSSHDQWAHLEPSFLLQKKRIHDTICLGAPYAARGPYAHLPCGSGSHHGWLCSGTVWYSSCADLMTLSWRQHGWVSQPWVPGERPCPLARLFQWGWDDCTAAGSGSSTVGAVLEIPALCSSTWHRHASCLLICKSALGWLAYWVRVGVSVWYFADSCNFILCCELVGISQLQARSKLLGWIVHHANHSYTAPCSLLAWIHPDWETAWVLTYQQNTMQTNPDVRGIYGLKRILDHFVWPPV